MKHIAVLKLGSKQHENVAKQEQFQLVDVSDSLHNIHKYRALHPTEHVCDIPVPGMDGMTSRTVEGIWQGLKVWDNEGIDTSKFAATSDVSRNGKKRVGPPKWRYGERLLELRDALKTIFVPAYNHHLDACRDQLLDILRMGDKIALFDFEDNTDIDCTWRPFTHAALIRERLYALDRSLGSLLDEDISDDDDVMVKQNRVVTIRAKQKDDGGDDKDNDKGDDRGDDKGDDLGDNKGEDDLGDDKGDDRGDDPDDPKPTEAEHQTALACVEAIVRDEDEDTGGDTNGDEKKDMPKPKFKLKLKAEGPEATDAVEKAKKSAEVSAKVPNAPKKRTMKISIPLHGQDNTAKSYDEYETPHVNKKPRIDINVKTALHI